MPSRTSTAFIATSRWEMIRGATTAFSGNIGLGTTRSKQPRWWSDRKTSGSVIRRMKTWLNLTTTWSDRKRFSSARLNTNLMENFPSHAWINFEMFRKKYFRHFSLANFFVFFLLYFSPLGFETQKEFLLIFSSCLLPARDGMRLQQILKAFHDATRPSSISPHRTSLMTVAGLV